MGLRRSGSSEGLEGAKSCWARRSTEVGTKDTAYLLKGGEILIQKYRQEGRVS
jgi:hypothetical protein